MRPTLKPLSEQVIVITGASSGIGLATARAASEGGAAVVLVARSEEALDQLATEINGRGGRALAVAADVSEPDAATRIADAAEKQFGRIDTWINNAGIGVYGRVEQVPVEDQRKAFEVNYWSIVSGSREAAGRLRRSGGGAIINLGSVVSERAVPLQGAYVATKHAIKGFTEALRMELEEEGAPISVTLIKPAQIDTPFTVNAKNFFGSEPQHVPKVYGAEVVAAAILRAATRPVRAIHVGGGGAVMATMGRIAPGLTDLLMENVIIPGSLSGRPPRRARDESGLDQPTENLSERGNYTGKVAHRSTFTAALLHPGAIAGASAVAGILLLRLLYGGGHRPAVFEGRKGSRRGEKGLMIHLKARRGRAGELETLLSDVWEQVLDEPATGPWFAFRLGKRRYGIFERFPDEAGRRAHLAGAGAARLLARSNAVLAKPARIGRVDVLGSKPSN